MQLVAAVCACECCLYMSLYNPTPCCRMHFEYTLCCSAATCCSDQSGWWFQLAAWPDFRMPVPRHDKPVLVSLPCAYAQCTSSCGAQAQGLCCLRFLLSDCLHADCMSCLGWSSSSQGLSRRGAGCAAPAIVRFILAAYCTVDGVASVRV
jgi:hypothetical protein